MKELFLASILISSYALAAIDKFQEFINYAQSLKDTVPKSLASFKPEEHLKNYTSNPPEVDHYHKLNTGYAAQVESAARTETAKSETGQAIVDSFQSKPEFKITRSEAYLQKSELFISNADNIVTGSSNKHINCEKGTTSACKIVQVEKACNEEVRTRSKTCEKVADPVVTISDFVNPNCHQAIIVQSASARCPRGYAEHVYADMIDGPTWDDVRICLKPAEVNECFAGYLINGAHPHMNLRTEHIIIPKNTPGRIRFTNAYHGQTKVTVINETTGQVLYDDTSFANGAIIPLPVADVDQSFRLEKSRLNHRGRGWSHGFIGVAIVYFDRVRKNITITDRWQEEPCRDT